MGEGQPELFRQLKQTGAKGSLASPGFDERDFRLHLEVRLDQVQKRLSEANGGPFLSEADKREGLWDQEMQVAHYARKMFLPPHQSARYVELQMLNDLSLEEGTFINSMNKLILDDMFEDAAQSSQEDGPSIAEGNNPSSQVGAPLKLAIARALRKSVKSLFESCTYWGGMSLISDCVPIPRPWLEYEFEVLLRDLAVATPSPNDAELMFLADFFDLPDADPVKEFFSDLRTLKDDWDPILRDLSPQSRVKPGRQTKFSSDPLDNLSPFSRMVKANEIAKANESEDEWEYNSQYSWNDNESDQE